jgi:hypothetical protein
MRRMTEKTLRYFCFSDKKCIFALRNIFADEKIHYSYHHSSAHPSGLEQLP